MRTETKQALACVLILIIAIVGSIYAADNFTGASGSPTFASDDISSVHYQRTKLIYGADGVNSGDVSGTNPLPVKPFASAGNDWSYPAANLGIVNTTTAVTIKAAVASNRNYITAIQFSAEALGTATELAIRDGAGGTVLWRTKIGTGGLVNGREIIFPSPLKSTTNTLLEVVTLTASGTGAVYFNAQGFVAP